MSGELHGWWSVRVGDPRLPAEPESGRPPVRLTAPVGGEPTAVLDVWAPEPEYRLSVAESNGHAVVVIRHPACPSGDDGEASRWLGGFARRGDDVMAEVRGEAVVLFWNGHTRRLAAMRPPGTTRRLFFSENGDQLHLSDNLRWLADRREGGPSLNRAMLASLVAERWYDAHETCFEGVVRVPPAHALVWGAAGVSFQQFWDPLPVGQPVEWIVDDVLARFDVLFEQAVKRAVGSERAAIFLSGGLDSVSVAAVATDMARRDELETPLALSLAMPDPQCDERETQAAVAAGLGLDQVFLDFDEALGGKGFLDAALDLAAGWPEPLQNFWLPAYMALAERARDRGCRTILTGGGGDEWLSVTPLLASDHLRRLRLVSWWRLWQTLDRSYDISRPRLLYNLVWRFGFRPMAVEAARAVLGSISNEVFPAVIRRRRRLPEWLAPDPVVQRTLLDREEELARRRQAMPREDEYVRECRQPVTHLLVGHRAGRAGGGGCADGNLEAAAVLRP